MEDSDKETTEGTSLGFQPMNGINVLQGLYLKLDDLSILQLIQITTNVNLPDTSLRTPLHLAVIRPTTTVAFSLIGAGAKVDAQDEWGLTPLCYATEGHHVDAVRLLLGYGADLHIRCVNGRSPLIFAFCSRHFDIASLLMNDYNWEDLCRDVNWYYKNNFPALSGLVLAGDPNLFKTVWIHISSIRNPLLFIDFIRMYLMYCPYDVTSWVHCLTVVLESSNTCNLFKTYPFASVQKYEELILRGRYNIHRHNLLQILLNAFTVRPTIAPSDRSLIISKLLKLGASTYLSSFAFVIQFFGVGEEIDPLLGRHYYRTKEDKKFQFPLCVYLLCIESDFSIKKIRSLFLNQICFSSQIDMITAPSHLMLALGFFSMPLHIKMDLLRYCRQYLRNYEPIQKKFRKIPELPSLQELCRNKAYKTVRRSCNVTKPSDFHNAVNSLNIPQKIKDIIRLKAPLYLK